MDKNCRLHIYLGLMCQNSVAGAWQPFPLKEKTEDTLGGQKMCALQ